MSPDGDITMNESQLLRAFGTPTAARCIHDPGYRPTHSYTLARQMSECLAKQACPSTHPLKINTGVGGWFPRL